MKKKNDKNYLDYIPVKNPEVEYETDENGRVTVFIEWKGFYHRIAQKFFHRPRVSPKMEKPLARLIKFLEILHDNHLIFWKGEERK